MKKVLPLLMLASTCLASCGDVSVYGKYQFLLGKQGDDETRVRLEMELKDEASSFKEAYKKFDARFELSGVAGLSKLDVDDEIKQALNEVLATLSITTDEDGVTTIPGFYNVQDLKDEKYGNKIRLAFDLGADINALFEAVELDPTEIVSNFVVAYCNGSSFTFQLPVSITDLQMQLCWYGIYVDINPYVKDSIHSITDFIQFFMEGKISTKVYQLKEYYDKKLPGEQDVDKRFGSHPSDEEVIEMNKKYQGLFSNTFVYKNVDGAAGEKLGSIFYDIDDKQYDFFPIAEDFDASLGTYDVIIKKDVGILNYDFSEDTAVTLTTVGSAWDDGSYSCGVKYAGTTTEIDWNDFYQDQFVFRDSNDIKIELKKE